MKKHQTLKLVPDVLGHNFGYLSVFSQTGPTEKGPVSALRISEAPCLLWRLQPPRGVLFSFPGEWSMVVVTNSAESRPLTNPPYSHPLAKEPSGILNVWAEAGRKASTWKRRPSGYFVWISWLHHACGRKECVWNALFPTKAGH